MSTHIARWITVAGLLVAVGGFGLYRLGERQGMAHRAVGAEGLTTEATARKPLYWHDPMVPAQRFDRPGKSPFMDMPLVPVYADDAADVGGVHIDSRVQQNLGLRTAPVVTGTLARTLEAPGSVAFDERDVRVLEARAAGFIERLHVRATLDPVRRGQALADLYVPEWVAAQEEYLTVKHLGAAGGEGLLDAARQRMRLVGMNEEQIKGVDSGNQLHSRLIITSPVDGVVAELGAREGMTVAAGALLFRINGLSTVWVNADVPESAAETLAVGTPAEIRTTALPGVVLHARVSALPPTVSAETRTRTVRLELANPRRELVPGMFTTVTFAAQSDAPTLLVPSEAVIRTGLRTVVIVAGENGTFSPVNVETGREGRGQTEVRKGLTMGQQVVVSGQFLLDSEASLTGAGLRMGPSPAPNDAPATKDDATAVEHHP